MRTREAASCPVAIYVAGDAQDATRVCRAHCLEVGLCVTVEPLTYVYAGGAETGVRVGLINYPRFPRDPVHLERVALVLARRLIDELHQQSAVVETPTRTTWLTRRPEDQ